MTLKNILAITILALMLAIPFWFATTAGAHSSHVIDELESCYWINAENISGETVVDLMAIDGWYPMKYDHGEFLYSPGCTSPGSAA